MDRWGLLRYLSGSHGQRLRILRTPARGYAPNGYHSGVGPHRCCQEHPASGEEGEGAIQEEPWRSGWYTPFIISSYDPSTLFVGGNRLLKSTDRGESWTPISPDLSDPAEGPRGVVPFGTITMIAESEIQPGLIYVGTEGGSVWITRNGGESWKKVSQGLPGKWVSRVLASGHQADRVFVSLTGFREDDFGSYLFRSDDGGESWMSITANLPAESVNVVQEDPELSEVLYVGTDLGVYVSGDGGVTWHSLSANLPTTPVHDLEVHPRDGELVVGTHGRSVFVLDLVPVRRWFEEGGMESAGALNSR